jgi:hypothetical protein
MERANSIGSSETLCFKAAARRFIVFHTVLDAALCLARRVRGTPRWAAPAHVAASALVRRTAARTRSRGGGKEGWSLLASGLGAKQNPREEPSPNRWRTLRHPAESTRSPGAATLRKDAGSVLGSCRPSGKGMSPDPGTPMAGAFSSAARLSEQAGGRRWHLRGSPAGPRTSRLIAYIHPPITM